MDCVAVEHCIVRRTAARLTNPALVTSVRPALLLKLLFPFRAYLAARGLLFPPRKAWSGPLDLDQLKQILMSPTEETPSGLIETFRTLEEVAASDRMPDVFDLAHRLGVLAVERPILSELDLLVEVWLKAPQEVEQIHAESLVNAPRKFYSYRAPGEGRLPDPNISTFRNNLLKSRLNAHFEAYLHGRNVEIQWFPQPRELWILIRHGGMLRYEEILRKGKPSAIAFHPLSYDVAVIQLEHRELRLNAPTKRERERYRTALAETLFGQGDLFSETDKYTLEPLRRPTADTLTCCDVECIHDVKLVELTVQYGQSKPEIQKNSSPDLLASLVARQEAISPSGRLTEAVFKFWFHWDRPPRTVRIQAGNLATYVRDDDSDLVDEFFRKRGFVRPLFTPAQVDHVVAPAPGLHQSPRNIGRLGPAVPVATRSLFDAGVAVS